MRQLKCYSCDVDDFIKSIISSTKERKRDEEESGCKYKQRCINLFSAHKIYIKRYKIEFVGIKYKGTKKVGKTC